MIILELILCFMIFLKICCFLTTKFLYSLIAYLTERSISVSIFFHQQVCMEILFFLNMDICKYHLSCFNRKNNLLKIGSFCVCVCMTPWIVAYQAPLSLEFPRQEYWMKTGFLILKLFHTKLSRGTCQLSLLEDRHGLNPDSATQRL